MMPLIHQGGVQIRLLKAWKTWAALLEAAEGQP